MSRFRSKPSECDAWQWSGPDSPLSMVAKDDKGCFVTTAHDQKCYLSPGDWIIKEPNHLGYYPCKPDVFYSRWEPIQESKSCEEAKAMIMDDLPTIGFDDKGKAYEIN